MNSHDLLVRGISVAVAFALNSISPWLLGAFLLGVFAYYVRFRYRHGYWLGNEDYDPLWRVNWWPNLKADLHATLTSWAYCRGWIGALVLIAVMFTVPALLFY